MDSEERKEISGISRKSSRPMGLKKKRDLLLKEQKKSHAVEGDDVRIVRLKNTEENVDRVIAPVDEVKELYKNSLTTKDFEERIMLIRATVHECDALLKKSSTSPLPLTNPDLYLIYASALCDLVEFDVEDRTEAVGFLDFAKENYLKANGGDISYSPGMVRCLLLKSIMERKEEELVGLFDRIDGDEEIVETVLKLLPLLDGLSAQKRGYDHLRFLLEKDPQSSKETIVTGKHLGLVYMGQANLWFEEYEESDDVPPEIKNNLEDAVKLLSGAAAKGSDAELLLAVGEAQINLANTLDDERRSVALYTTAATNLSQAEKTWDQRSGSADGKSFPQHLHQFIEEWIKS